MWWHLYLPEARAGTRKHRHNLDTIIQNIDEPAILWLNCVRQNTLATQMCLLSLQASHGTLHLFNKPLEFTTVISYNSCIFCISCTEFQSPDQVVLNPCSQIDYCQFICAGESVLSLYLWGFLLQIAHWPELRPLLADQAAHPANVETRHCWNYSRRRIREKRKKGEILK